MLEAFQLVTPVFATRSVQVLILEFYLSLGYILDSSYWNVVSRPIVSSITWKLVGNADSGPTPACWVKFCVCLLNVVTLRESWVQHRATVFITILALHWEGEFPKWCLNVPVWRHMKGLRNSVKRNCKCPIVTFIGSFINEGMLEMVEKSTFNRKSARRPVSMLIWFN